MGANGLHRDGLPGLDVLRWPRMEIVVVLCAGPPILAIVLCFGCYIGLRRAIRRERVEAGCLAEELCILIGRGQMDRARSRLRAASGPLARALDRLGLTWSEVHRSTGPDAGQVVNSAASRVGSLWELPVQLTWAMSGVGAIGCATVGFVGWFLIPWWNAESDGLPDGRALVVSLFAGLGLVAVRLIATSTCKLMERERRAIQEQILESLSSIHGLTHSPPS